MLANNITALELKTAVQSWHNGTGSLIDIAFLLGIPTVQIVTSMAKDGICDMRGNLNYGLDWPDTLLLLTLELAISNRRELEKRTDRKPPRKKASAPVNSLG